LSTSGRIEVSTRKEFVQTVKLPGINGAILPASHRSPVSTHPAAADFGLKLIAIKKNGA
jgi:hypothetical protein